MSNSHDRVQLVVAVTLRLGAPTCMAHQRLGTRLFPAPPALLSAMAQLRAVVETRALPPIRLRLHRDWVSDRAQAFPEGGKRTSEEPRT
jgi:hypothetical protein